MLSRSAITLVQLQVGNNSEKFKNKIRQQLISDQIRQFLVLLKKIKTNTTI